MKFLVRRRQEGKTHALIEWVKEGHRIDSYPGWSRILVTHNMSSADQLRGGTAAQNPYGLDYHQVFYLDEWRTSWPGPEPVEVAFDNIDLVLQDLLRFPGRLTIVSATGEIA